MEDRARTPGMPWCRLPGRDGAGRSRVDISRRIHPDTFSPFLNSDPCYIGPLIPLLRWSNATRGTNEPGERGGVPGSRDRARQH